MSLRGGVETITPDDAVRLLEAVKDDQHIRNRPVKDSHVRWLSTMIKAGKWRLNGEAVLLDQDGKLLDGQHRLYAVIEAETPIETYVVRGVDRDYFATIDTGAGRTVGDVLGIKGELYCAQLAAVLGWLWRYEQGKMLSGVKASGYSQEIALAVLRRHPAVKDAVTWSNTKRHDTVLGIVAPSPLAFLKYVFSQHKPNKAEE